MIGHFSAMIFIIIGLLSQLAMSDLPPINSIVPLVLEILVSVGVLFVYIKYKKSIVFIRYVTIGFSAVYVVMMLMASSGTVFPYIVPYVICVALSMDIWSVNVIGVVFVVANVIRVIMTVAGASDISFVLEAVMIEMIITILVTLAALRGVRHLTTFFAESMSEIMEASRKNEAVAQRIVEVARTVEGEAESMARDLESIEEATQTVSESMDNISLGTTGTAEAIVEQTQQTQDIQEILDETRDRTDTIVALTKSAKEALDSGQRLWIPCSNRWSRLLKTAG